MVLMDLDSRLIIRVHAEQPIRIVMIKQKTFHVV